MQRQEKKQVLVDSLLAMRNSLLNSYEMRTTVKEEGLLLKGLTQAEYDYIVFSDYRRNDGRRRIFDAIEIIDESIEELNRAEYPSATRVYLDALKSVAKMTRMANVLECQCIEGNFKEKRNEGTMAPKLA